MSAYDQKALDALVALSSSAPAHDQKALDALLIAANALSLTDADIPASPRRIDHTSEGTTEHFYFSTTAESISDVNVLAATLRLLWRRIKVGGAECDFFISRARDGSTAYRVSHARHT